jgi:hypothetical protein
MQLRPLRRAASALFGRRAGTPGRDACRTASRTPRRHRQDCDATEPRRSPSRRVRLRCPQQAPHPVVSAHLQNGAADLERLLRRRKSPQPGGRSRDCFATIQIARTIGPAFRSGRPSGPTQVDRQPRLAREPGSTGPFRRAPRAGPTARLLGVQRPVCKHPDVEKSSVGWVDQTAPPGNSDHRRRPGLAIVASLGISSNTSSPR